MERSLYGRKKNCDHNGSGELISPTCTTDHGASDNSGDVVMSVMIGIDN